MPGSICVGSGAVADVFDEDAYLAANPDVAAAVARGDFISGLRHFELFGRVEGRPPASPADKWYILCVDVFSYCNLRCPSCLVGNKFGDIGDWRRGVMSPALLGKILDKALSECSVSMVALYNWTEPLLHPDLPEMIRVVKTRGLPCWISSNLNVLRSPMELLATGLDWLRISVSGFTQDVYRVGHRGGDVEKVKTNMCSLAAARSTTGAATTIQVFYHRYRHNESEVEPMAAFARSLNFVFRSTLAYLSPVEKVIAIAAGDKSAEDDVLLANLAVPLDSALAVTSRIRRSNCGLLEDIITIDVAGNAVLCCGSSMNGDNIIGSFLDLPLAEIQRRRRERSLCRQCMALGLQDYIAGPAEFEKIAAEVTPSSSP